MGERVRGESSLMGFPRVLTEAPCQEATVVSQSSYPPVNVAQQDTTKMALLYQTPSSRYTQPNTWKYFHN